MDIGLYLEFRFINRNRQNSEQMCLLTKLIWLSSQSHYDSIFYFLFAKMIKSFQSVLVRHFIFIFRLLAGIYINS